MLFKYSISGVQFYISLLDTSVLQSLYIVKKICLKKKKKKEKENKTEKTKTIIISLKKASTSIIFSAIKVLLGRFLVILGDF